LTALLAAMSAARPARGQCSADCDLNDRVTAAEIVALNIIAATDGSAAACIAADLDRDGEISPAERDEAIHSVFADCTAPPPPYDGVATATYQLAFPTAVMDTTQAVDVLAALELDGTTDEAELRALLPQLLDDAGIDPNAFEEIGLYTVRQDSGSCEDCLATCSGRCVRNSKGECFCYEPLPPDPARVNVAVLLLADADDEAEAFDAIALRCPPTLFPGGVNDSFNPGNGIEPTSPSPGLQLLLQQSSGQPSVPFDTTAIDRQFAHTFTLPLGQCIYSLKLLFRARPLSGNPSPGSRNDVIRAGFVNAAGQFVGAQWAAYFGTGNTGLPLLLPNQWSPSQHPNGGSFMLNLGAVPGMLADLDARRSLDLYLQDDSAIDYARILVGLCPCPIPTPTPSATASRSFTPTRTPTPTLSRTPTRTATFTPRPTSTPTVPLPSRTSTATPTLSRTPTLSPTPVTPGPCVAPPAFANMIAWWPLDDPAGGSVVADIGAAPANNGVARPNFIDSPPAGNGPESVAGNLITAPPDRAFFFYSPATYAEVAPGIDLDLANDDLTVDAWVVRLAGT
jgi:hypothetical protein